MQTHPEAAGKLSVTGHSLGGALAQVSSQMYGLKGVTFDPGGAHNLVQSQEFRNWATSHGLPPQGRGVPESFSNYIVNKSGVSHLSGQHVGKQQIPVSGTAERSWISLMAGSAPSFFHIGGLAGTATYGASQGYDQTQRHSMDRIEKVFESAARTGSLNQIGMQFDGNAKIQLANLSKQIDRVQPGLTDTQNANLTFYVAHKSLNEGISLDSIDQLKSITTPSGKNILGISNADHSIIATADINKGIQIPAEQSLQAMMQPLEQTQAPAQQQRNMTV